MYKKVINIIWITILLISCGLFSHNYGDSVNDTIENSFYFNKDELQTLVNIPNSQQEIEQLALNDELEQAKVLANANLEAIKQSANQVEVSNQQQLMEAIARGGNTLITIIDSFEVDDSLASAIIPNNSIVTIEGLSGNETITVNKRTQQSIMENAGNNNIMINVDNITLQGSLATNTATTNTTVDTVDNKEFIYLSGGNNIEVNLYQGFKFTNMNSIGESAIISLDHGNQTANFYGSTIENNRACEHKGLIGGRGAGSKVNIFDIKMLNNYSDRFLLTQADEEAAYTNIFGGEFGGNLTCEWWYGRGINQTLHKNVISQSETLKIFANHVITKDNWAVDEELNKIQPQNIGLVAISDLLQLNNEEDVISVVNNTVIYNPTPDGKLQVTSSWGSMNGDEFDEQYSIWLENTLPGWKGIPLAVIKYTDDELSQQYANNKKVEGITTDFSTAVSNKTHNWLTTDGKYELQEENVNGVNYLILTKKDNSFKYIVIGAIIIIAIIILITLIVLKKRRKANLNKN